MLIEQGLLNELNPMLQQIRQIDPYVVTAAILADETLPIHASERELISHAIVQRRAEFAGGRWCAHQCMTQLGIRPVPLLRGAQGQPLWPTQMVGSISHESGVCVAIARPQMGVTVIGIDLFDRRRSSLAEESMEWIIGPGDNDAIPPALLFCIKESAIKAFASSLPMDMRNISVQLRHHVFIARHGSRFCYGYYRSTTGWFVAVAWGTKS